MKFDYYTREGVLYGAMIRSLMSLPSTDILDSSLHFNVRRNNSNRVTVRDYNREVLILEGNTTQRNRTEYRNLSFSPNGSTFTTMGVSFIYIDITDPSNTECLMALSNTQRFINGIYYALYGYYGTERHIDGSTYVVLNTMERLFPLPKGVQI